MKLMLGNVHGCFAYSFCCSYAFVLHFGTSQGTDKLSGFNGVHS